MKYALGLLSLAFLLPPAAALADDTQPPPPPPGASAPAGDQHAFFNRMREDHAQIAKIMLQARSQMLGALTPEHRALLAKVVGQLAVSTNPDPEAAARQLDAALSPSEGKAVLAAEENAHTQMRSLMQGAREHGARPGGNMGPGRGGPGGPGGPPPDGKRHEHRTPDAGRILLRMASFAPMERGPR
ncbi:MAG: hypothetical protein ACLPSH_01630 [Vulcanimicrobiaceae bacterium]